MRYYEHNVKLEMEKCKMPCVGETYKNKMLKLQEISKCHESLLLSL